MDEAVVGNGAPRGHQRLRDRLASEHAPAATFQPMTHKAVRAPWFQVEQQDQLGNELLGSWRWLDQNGHPIRLRGSVAGVNGCRELGAEVARRLPCPCCGKATAPAGAG